MAELAQEILSAMQQSRRRPHPVHTYSLSDLPRPLISVFPSDMAALEHACLRTQQEWDLSLLQAEAHSQ